jgi:hypothetical protein
VRSQPPTPSHLSGRLRLAAMVRDPYYAVAGAPGFFPVLGPSKLRLPHSD